MREKSRFFNRILSVLVATGVIPVIALGMTSFFQASSADLARVQEANVRALERSKQEVDQVLRSIQSHYLLLVSEYLRFYDDLTLDDLFSQYDRLIDLQRRLLEFQNLESAVRTTYFVNLRQDWIVGNDGIGSYSSFTNTDIVNDVLRKPDGVGWSGTSTPADTTLHMNISRVAPVEEYYMYAKYPLSASNPIGILIVNLSTTALATRLSPDLVNSNTVVLGMNGEPALVGPNADEWVARTSTELNSLIRAQPGKRGFFYASLPGGRIGVTYEVSDLIDWVYAAVYSVREITQSSRSIGIWTAIIVLVTAVVVTIASVFFSSFLTRPVRKTFDMVREVISGGDRSPGRDEFAVIDRGIHQLVDSRSEMERTIKEQVSRLQEFFLLDLIHGRLGADEIASRLARLGLDGSWKRMCIATIQLVQPTLQFTGRYSHNLVLVSIQEVVRDIIPIHNRLAPAVSRHGVVVLIGDDTEDDRRFRNDVADWLVSIQDIAENDLSAVVAIGVSRCIRSLENARTAERESAEALMFRKRSGEKVLLFYADLVFSSSHKTLPYPESLEASLINAISAVDTEKAQDILTELVDRITGTSIDTNELELALVRMTVEIVRILQDIGEPAGFLISSEPVFEGLRSLVDPKEIVERLMVSVVAPTIERLRERRSRHFREILEKVVNIVETEFDTDLTLESCARRLNYHPTHIWRIFKEEYNTTFSDYLAGHRMKVAKEWLAATDRSVGEIAVTLRYSNSQNFIRFFKRMEGLTPGQYRDRFSILSQN